MAERDLQKTINIDGKDYDINAVYSDEAGKVTNQLTVTESTTGNKSADSSFAFDGSADRAIDYVPADGGKFRGPICVRDMTNDELNDHTVIINSKQVNGRITHLNGAPLCVWNTSLSGTKLEESLYSLTDETKNPYKFTAITGTEADFYLLQGVLTSNNTELTYALVNTISPALGWKTTGFKDTNVSGIVVVPDKYSGTYNNATYNNPVRQIGASTFKGKTKVISVLLPDGETATESLQKGIREIENYAFQGCIGLKSIVIPNSVRSDNTEGWFDGCTSLKSVILSKGKNFTSIGVKLFQNCTGLDSIVIPTNITSIGANAFNGCTNLKKVYYAGSSEQWSAISISSTGNEALNTAAKVYNYTPAEVTPAAGTPIDLSEESKGPLLYICKDEESSDLPVSNKVFLKLPDTNEFVEISKGAARLESPEGATTQGFYTYETLAAVIAGINSRLEALGADALTLPTKLDSIDHIVIPETLNSTIKNEVIVDPNKVPTVQELQDQITQINGVQRTYNTTTGKVSYSAITVTNPTPALQAIDATNATNDGAADHRNIATGYYRTNNINTATDKANQISILHFNPDEYDDVETYIATVPGNLGDIAIIIEPED